MTDNSNIDATTKQVEKFYTDAQKYVTSTLSIQDEEWKFVEQCNSIMLETYERLDAQTSEACGNIEAARRQVARLPVYLEQMEELETAVEMLENIAKGLDDYSLQLEKKFVPI